MDFPKPLPVPRASTGEAKRMLGDALKWGWSERARDFLTQFEKVTELFLSPDELRSEMIAKWGYCHHAIVAMQIELAGLSVPSEIDGSPCVLGIRDISTPNEIHPMSQIVEGFYHQSANTQFGYYIGHEGTIFSEDVPHAANAQVFLEREAVLRSPIISANAARDSIQFEGVARRMAIENVVLLSNSYATQLGMKVFKGAIDHLGGVWEGEDSFGSVVQGITEQNLFIYFASPNSHLLEEMSQEFARLGLMSRR